MKQEPMGRAWLAMALLAAGAASAGELAVTAETVEARAKLLGIPMKLLPAGATANAAAGTAVALGQDIALVGSAQDAARGAVYVYTRPVGGSYTFKVRLLAPDGANGDTAQFGLALAFDGNRLVVGAPFNLGIGAAYVFTHTGGGNFVFEQKIVPADGAVTDEFGTAVAVDGTTLAVGARLGNLGATNGGAVYVYTRAASFVLQQKLTSDSAVPVFSSQNGANFGAALALAGNSLYIGAPFYNGGEGLLLKFTRSGSVWSGGANRNAGPQPAQFGSAIARAPNGAVYVGAPNGQNPPGTITGFVFAYDDSQGFLGFVGQVDNPAAADTRFGSAIAADDGALIVGAPSFDGPALDQGEFYSFTVAGAGAQPVLRGRTLASDGGASDKLGTAIAYRGGALLVGASGDDDAQANAGAAYAYDTAVEETRLVDPAGGPDDIFGSAIAIAGNVKMIGTPHSGGQGSVEIYQRVIDVWTKSDNDIRLDPSLAQFECAFGASVAMSDDTTLVVVGAPKYDVGAQTDDRGRAFVYERSGNAWVPAGTLSAGDAEPGDLFGASVSISPDGNTVVVGAPNKGPTDDGKIYVFKRPPPAPLAAAKGAGFTSTGSRPGGIGDKFGASVGVDNAGTIAVGAPLRGGGDAGAVEVMRDAGGGNYAIEVLTDPSAAAGDNFGTAVALRNGELVVGIPNADRPGQAATDNAGAAMMFDAGATSSTPRGARMMPSDARLGDKFGTTVGVSDGVAIVGAPLRDVVGAGGGTRTDAGSARLLLRTGLQWSVDAEVVASDTDVGDNFGSAVAINGRTLTSGAPLNDYDVNNFANQGASYVFRIGPPDPALFEDGFE